MPQYRHFYIGDLRLGGSLRELSGLLETQLKASNIYIGEASQEALSNPIQLEGDIKFRANVAFLLSQPAPYNLNIITNILSKRLAPSALISFDSPLSPDDILLPPYYIDRNDFLNQFKLEATFVGFFTLEWKQTASVPKNSLEK
jgi:hypothetical protein